MLVMTESFRKNVKPLYSEKPMHKEIINLTDDGKSLLNVKDTANTC